MFHEAYSCLYIISTNHMKIKYMSEINDEWKNHRKNDNLYYISHDKIQ